MPHTGKLIYFPFLSNRQKTASEFYIRIEISHISKGDDFYMTHYLSVDTESKIMSLYCSLSLHKI